jgi:hypothetical protein
MTFENFIADMGPKPSPGLRPSSLKGGVDFIDEDEAHGPGVMLRKGAGGLKEGK